jgi:hypothetical protein
VLVAIGNVFTQQLQQQAHADNLAQHR